MVLLIRVWFSLAKLQRKRLHLLCCLMRSSPPPQRIKQCLESTVRWWFWIRWRWDWPAALLLLDEQQEQILPLTKSWSWRRKMWLFCFCSHAFIQHDIILYTQLEVCYLQNYFFINNLFKFNLKIIWNRDKNL